MARPPLPLGTWGSITTDKFRDHGGNTRGVIATGPSKATAEGALRDILATRTASAGELVTAETRLIDLANLWIKITLRHRGMLYSIGIGRTHTGTRVIVLSRTSTSGSSTLPPANSSASSSWTHPSATKAPDAHPAPPAEKRRRAEPTSIGFGPPRCLETSHRSG